ncbi:prephenate dehydrogenase [Thermodesulfobium sp. 4217-1]|uniref:prephenate dehydrogenase n=1 Tax=Thermodesulfobium sp. 4217-1 TaxID=3120013 RepID=UPI003222226D
MDFKNICVIGLGLIGGSLAKAFAANGYSIFGYDSKLDTVKLAKSEKIFYHLNNELDSNISSCDLVFVCVNIENTLDVFTKLVPYLKNGCVVSDVASVKSHFFNKVVNQVPDGVNFVSTHPMAGTQYCGYENSFKEIFIDRPLLIIKSDEKKALIDNLANFLKINLKVNIQLVGIDEHDSLVSLTSHLPMFVAVSLSNTVKKYDQTFPYLNLVAGPGFKDTSRLALQDPNFTHSIFRFNKKELLKAVDSYIDTLSSLRESLRGDDESFKKEIINAKEFRGRF